MQAIKLRTGLLSGIMTESAAPIVSTAGFDAAYAVRTIGDVVPNAFTAWALLGEPPQWFHAVGAALILPSIWVATRGR